MERTSDEQLNVLISFAASDVAEAPGAVNYVRFLALTELRERREADKRPCSFSQAFNEGDGTYRP